MTPTFAHGRGGRLYRYYVSAGLQQRGQGTGADSGPRRVSATVIERHLESALLDQATDHRHAGVGQLGRIRRVELHADRLLVTLQNDESERPRAEAPLVLHFAVSTRTGRTRITTGSRDGPHRDPVLIRALRSAHALLDRDAAGLPTLDAAPLGPHRNRTLRLAFLAPDLQQRILEGRQPSGLTLAALLADETPLLWSEQRARLAARG